MPTSLSYFSDVNLFLRVLALMAGLPLVEVGHGLDDPELAWLRDLIACKLRPIPPQAPLSP